MSQLRCVVMIYTGLCCGVSSNCHGAEDGKTMLFNGQDLTGWTYYLEDASAERDDVWSVRDGVLVCTGAPAGYLRTRKDYGDYVLSLEWRWPPGTEGGNNGVLVHTSTPAALGVWPKSIEVQLGKGDAGDFWVIGTDLDVPNEAERKQGRRHINLTDDSEKPLGQWNHMEIRCSGDTIEVKVNGDMVNRATNCSVTRGAIALQSEGALIEYRNISLRPLDEKKVSGTFFGVRNHWRAAVGQSLEVEGRQRDRKSRY